MLPEISTFCSGAPFRVNRALGLVSLETSIRINLFDISWLAG
jgi:hypothetical protein